MSITLKIITLVFVLMKSSRCAMVSKPSPKGTVFVSHYCPKQKFCREGTHVMCMYYDRNRKYGPSCRKPVKTVITSKIVDTILENVNELRSRIANGKETGKDNIVLPKAYGMMKLEWDRELATLAQVLANQCLGGKEDLCRATDRFQNPSQSIAVINFKYPNWEYLMRRYNNSEKGLNEEKLIFAIVKFIKSAQALKKTLTKEIIMEYPPSHELEDINLKYYLNLIRGGATHIGCGISAYTKYKDDGEKKSIQNNVQVVCNISDGPQSTLPVYNTDPPYPGGSLSKRCGCPRGYKETSRCLCENDPEYEMQKNTVAVTTPGYLNSQPTFKYRKLKDPIIKLPSFRPSVEWAPSQYEFTQKQSPQEEDLKPDLNEKIEKRTRSDIEQWQQFSKNRFYPDEPSIDQALIFRNTRIVDAVNNEENSLREEKAKDEYPEKLYDEQTLTPDRKVYEKIYDKNVPLKKSLRNPKMIKLQNSNQNVNSVEDKLYDVEEAIAEGKPNIAEEIYAKRSKPNNYVNKADTGTAIELKKNQDNSYLLALITELEEEVKKTNFDANLKQTFEGKMNKIYEIVETKPLGNPFLKLLPTQLNGTSNNIKNLKYYLKINYNGNIDDKITALSKKPNRLTKDTKKDNKLTYFEIESKQNYSNDGQISDESTEINNANNLYKDKNKLDSNNYNNSNQMSLEQHENDFKYNFLNRNVNLDPHEDNDLPDSFLSINQGLLGSSNDVSRKACTPEPCGAHRVLLNVGLP